jgi:serine/threonine-protein kinase HipA
MLITGNQRFSQITVCLQAASQFLLTDVRAMEIVTAQLRVIREQWDSVCDEANLTEVDRSFLWQRQFLNPFALQEFEES